MFQTNPLWGAPRIHGELLKLGINVSQATVAKYLPSHRHPPSQTWKTFLANQVGQMMAADFIVVPTTTCRLLFVLVILAHERRHVIHIAVTDRPTAAWTAQQLREAFPFGSAPRYLVRDRDHAFADWSQTAKAMDIHEVVTAPRSPWQNGYVEPSSRSLRLVAYITTTSAARRSAIRYRWPRRGLLSRGPPGRAERPPSGCCNNAKRKD